MPPYTTRSSGRSATSGSRLFMSMRSGASVCQLRAVSVVPRGARTATGVPRSYGWFMVCSSSVSVGLSVGLSVEASVELSDGGRGCRRDPARRHELDHVLDLRGQVAVRSGTGHDGADGVEHRARTGSRGLRAEV